MAHNSHTETVGQAIEVIENEKEIGDFEGEITHYDDETIRLRVTGVFHSFMITTKLDMYIGYISHHEGHTFVILRKDS